MEAYNAAFTKFYRDENRTVFPQEEQLFGPSIREAKGKILEIGCGTGRFYFHYLKEGIEIEGFDPSEEMLAVFKQEAKKVQASPLTYCQSMQNLSLGSQYALIFGPQFVMQNLEVYEEVKRSLKNFFNHLEPKGKLILVTTFPKMNLETVKYTIPERKVQDSVELGTGEKGGGQRVYASGEGDFCAQVLKQNYRVETWDKGRVKEKSAFTRVFRWYSPQEMKLLLEQAGFEKVGMSTESSLPPNLKTKGICVNFTCFKP